MLPTHPGTSEPSVLCSCMLPTHPGPPVSCASGVPVPCMWPQAVQAQPAASSARQLLQALLEGMRYNSPASMALTLVSFAAVARDVRSGGPLRQLQQVMQVGGGVRPFDAMGRRRSGGCRGRMRCCKPVPAHDSEIGWSCGARMAWCPCLPLRVTTCPVGRNGNRGRCAHAA